MHETGREPSADELVARSGLGRRQVDDLFDTFYSPESPAFSYYLRRQGVTLDRPEPAA